MDEPVIVMRRLKLRPLTDSDLEAFAEINADPRVMEFMVRTITRAAVLD